MGWDGMGWDRKGTGSGTEGRCGKRFPRWLELHSDIPPSSFVHVHSFCVYVPVCPCEDFEWKWWPKGRVSIFSLLPYPSVRPVCVPVLRVSQLKIVRRIHGQDITKRKLYLYLSLEEQVNDVWEKGGEGVCKGERVKRV